MKKNSVIIFFGAEPYSVQTNQGVQNVYSSRELIIRMNSFWTWDIHFRFRQLVPSLHRSYRFCRLKRCQERNWFWIQPLHCSQTYVSRSVLFFIMCTPSFFAELFIRCQAATLQLFFTNRRQTVNAPFCQLNSQGQRHRGRPVIKIQQIV